MPMDSEEHKSQKFESDPMKPETNSKYSINNFDSEPPVEQQKTVN